MRKFDTKVQYLKYKVLREVAREAFKGICWKKLLKPKDNRTRPEADHALLYL